MGSILRSGWRQYNMAKEYMDNYYREGRPSDKYPAPTGSFGTALVWNQRVSTRWVEKADYLRIENVSLRYNLPEDLIPFNIASASVSLIGNNLHTFTSFSGMDPEASFFRNDPLSQGISSAQYPLSRSYHLKIQVGF